MKATAVMENRSGP